MAKKLEIYIMNKKYHQLGAMLLDKVHFYLIL